MAYNKLAALVVQTKLNNLFANYFFSVCDLREAVKAAGKDSVIPAVDMRALEALHCTNWRDMTPELRAELHRKIYLYFAPYLPPALDAQWTDRKAEAEDAEVREEQPSTWGRIRTLLGYRTEKV